MGDQKFSKPLDPISEKNQLEAALLGTHRLLDELEPHAGDYSRIQRLAYAGVSLLTAACLCLATLLNDAGLDWKFWGLMITGLIFGLLALRVWRLTHLTRADCWVFVAMSLVGVALLGYAGYQLALIGLSIFLIVFHVLLVPEEALLAGIFILLSQWTVTLLTQGGYETLLPQLIVGFISLGLLQVVARRLQYLSQASKSVGEHLHELTAYLANRLDEERHARIQAQDIDRQSGFLTVDAFLRRVTKESFLKELDKKAATPVIFSVLITNYDQTVRNLAGADEDALVAVIAERLSRALSKQMIHARVSKNEFSFFAHISEEQSEALELIRSWCQVLTQPFHLGGKVIYLKAYAGLASSTRGADFSGLLKESLQAADFAASEGREQVVVYNPEIQKAARDADQMLSCLRQAVSKNEFIVYYQPIVDIVTGGIVKAETLIRWNSKELGMVSPGKFVPLAERNGVIHELTSWMLKAACQDLSRFRQQINPAFQLSVNISPLDVGYSDDLVAKISDNLQQQGLNNDALVVEITEGVFLDANQDAMGILQDLRSRGLGLALDDFGTGYSSLSYLSKFEIDYLKIDQSFVSDIAMTPAKRVICKAIIAMAKALNMKVVAEGIETAEQLKILADYGCDYAQGYYFAKPMPSENFAEFCLNYR